MARFVTRVLLAAALTYASASAADAQTVSTLDWHVTPSRIASECDSQITLLQQRAAAISSLKERATFASTTLALENAVANANDALAAGLFLANVATDKTVEDAAVACQTKFSDAMAAITADPRLFHILAGAHRSTRHNAYDSKLAALWVSTFQRAGAGLSPLHRAEYLRLSAELTDVQNRFGVNLADASESIVLSRRATTGIPEDLLASYEKQRDGSYRVPVNEGTQSLLSYAQDEDARKRYWIEFNDRAAAVNVPLFERAVAIRDRLSHLLGYESWADYQLSDRMAKTLPRAQSFLQNLQTTLQPKTAKEMEAMRVAIANDEHRSVESLQPWDVRRGEYLLQKQHAIDPDEVRQYFPVQHTIDATLQIYHTVLGVDFERVVNPDAWAPGVLEYRVTDSSTRALLGITYFDLYPRPHKFGHFANFPILPARVINGVRRPAIAAIVGNWPQPATGRPALLSHSDVIAFFHEFGHCMASMLATAPYETLTNGFREDFVEAPSQMLENFAWQPQILKAVSSQWKTGESMPDDTVAKLIASRSDGQAYETSRIVGLSLYDLRVHSSGPRVDSTSLFAKTAGALLPLYAAGTHPQVAFNHLMFGYDAGLYAYPWAKVYAQDMFTAFQNGGLESAAVGMRYRNAILAPARTYEPDAEVLKFLGRPMSTQPFFSVF